MTDTEFETLKASGITVRHYRDCNTWPEGKTLATCTDERHPFCCMDRKCTAPVHERDPAGTIKTSFPAQAFCRHCGALLFLTDTDRLTGDQSEARAAQSGVK